MGRGGWLGGGGGGLAAAAGEFPKGTLTELTAEDVAEEDADDEPKAGKAEAPKSSLWLVGAPFLAARS